MRAVRKFGKAVRAKFVQVEDKKDEDEFKEGMQEVAAMRARYQGLLERSTKASQKAYQFAVAQQEYGTYVMETFGSLENEDIAECYIKVGKVQQEIASLLNTYSMQVAQAIKGPTEDLLLELGKVEDSKRAYDEHRLNYEQHRQRLSRQKGRGREVNVNGEELLQDEAFKAAKDEFDEATMQLGCELLSLEQKRPKALLAQAVRHQASQMRLFSGGLQQLHSVEPYIKSVMHAKNISARFDDSEDEEEEEDFGSPGSVEHPEALYDWDDHSTASPLSTPRSSLGVELTELPPQLPPEWNTLLNHLNETLEQMGEETLDSKDALFTMNAMLMAAHEQSTRFRPEEPQRTLSGQQSGSRSAPLSSTGVPLFMLGGPIPLKGVAEGGPPPTSATPLAAKTTPASTGLNHSGGGVPPPGAAKLPTPSAVGSAFGGPPIGTRSGPLTSSGLPLSVAANGGASSASKVGAPRGGSSIPAPPRRRIANSGPILPSAATRSGPLLASNPAMAKSASTSSATSPPVPQAAPPGPASVPPRLSSMFSSRSGPIILMGQERGPRISKSGPLPMGGPQPGGGVAEEGPHPLPTAASAGPVKVPASSTISPFKSNLLFRSPLSHPSSTSPMTSPPYSPPRDTVPYKLPPPPLSSSTATASSGSLTPASAPLPMPPPAPGGVRGPLRPVTSLPSRSGGKSDAMGGLGNPVAMTGEAVPPTSVQKGRSVSAPAYPVEGYMSSESSHRGPHTRAPQSPEETFGPSTTQPSPPSHLRRSLSFGQEKGKEKAIPQEEQQGQERVPLPLPEDETLVSPSLARRHSGSNLPAGGAQGGGPHLEPFMSLSSPLPAMPPPTPPERPELQGALSVLGGRERDQLLQTVGSDEFKWRWLEAPAPGGLRQAPEWTSMAKGQQEMLLQTLARAVVCRRDGFNREQLGFMMDGGDGFPESPLMEEVFAGQ